jgi:hypothetical protein
MPKSMSHGQLLAAEIFNYSYANYQSHLGGNLRFDRLMPQEVDTLETADQEGWPIEQLASKLEIDNEQAEDLLRRLDDARAVVDAENPAESFRTSVRQSIRLALELGFDSEEDIEKLVTQICYRASDLAYLLQTEGSSLSRYSRHLRREPDVEYYDGYFDEQE